MPIRVPLRHRTIQAHERCITLELLSVRLRPASRSRTKMRSYSLRVEPSKQFHNRQQDVHSNDLSRVWGIFDPLAR